MERCAASAWFYYATLLALQTKILWGIWAQRDLTSGDTSYYFMTAEEFSRNLTCVVQLVALVPYRGSIRDRR